MVVTIVNKTFNLPIHNLPVEGKGKFFTLQWHLTYRCEHRCTHCYFQEFLKHLSTRELDTLTCKSVLDDFKNFIDSFSDLKLKGRVVFTGGDPLLREDLFELLKYAKEKNFSLSILGNPDLITIQIAKKLKKYIRFYQLSLDGLEKTHDKIRRKGSFRDTVNAIHILKRMGIKVKIMFTISKLNVTELIPTMRYALLDLDVDRFDFARLVPVNSLLKRFVLSAEEYRKILNDVLDFIKNKIPKKYVGRIGVKENLWKLLLYEKGLYKPPKTRKIIEGCSMAINSLSIMPDGTVYPCSRLPIKIGKVPEESLKTIFLFKAKEFRNVEKLEKCKKCKLFPVCRGCPAVAYATYGRWTAFDPQCWLKV